MNDTGKLRVAVLISGSGTNLQAIIDAVAAGRLNAELIAVLSDNPDAYGLQRAEQAGIVTYRLDFHSFADRTDYDAELHRQLRHIDPDLVVLAGYMRIIADRTVEHFAGRMLNVHPSLLPAYPGLHTYRRALAAGETWHGTTVHLVIPELDAGPPVLQYRVKIHPGETEQSLRERVQTGEYRIYPLCIQWLAEGKLEFREQQPWLDGRPLTAPAIIDETTELKDQHG